MALKDSLEQLKADNTAIRESVDNIAADIAALDAKITQLQNSPGTISPEDQALLDEIVGLSAGLKTKVADVAASHPEAPTV